MPDKPKPERVRSSLVLQLRLTLHHAGGAHALFAGRPEHCLQVPHVGDSVLVGERSFQIEGIRYIFRRPDALEIQLLA